MKTAIFADIHANLEALQACLVHARRQGAERHVFLGDMVGYGADPLACLDLIRRQDAALCVLGNHDAAALGGLCESMNPLARESAYWTRKQLGAAEREFLAALPLVRREHELLFVHASANRPEAWEYIAGAPAASRCLAAADDAAAGADNAAPHVAPQTAGVFAGHVHHPQLYFEVGGGMLPFQPRPGIPVALPQRRRWLALTGSVGQSRDGNPAASYVLLDAQRMRLTFHRVPYDAALSARKVLAAGLPDELAWRLERGI